MKNKIENPYINSKGDIILPASWRDDEDDLSEEEYEKLIGENNHESNQRKYI